MGCCVLLFVQIDKLKKKKTKQNKTKKILTAQSLVEASGVTKRS